MGARPLLLKGLLLLFAAQVPPAWAGPWEARSGDGLVVRVEQDSFRTREGYLLTRRYPDGTPDAQFGEQGSTVFSLGADNEGPASLRQDAQGRLWIAGASLGAGDQLQAVVLRFGTLGRPDRGFGQGGRSAVQPGGRPARALDLVPQADGSAYVAGIVNDASGAERTGWWRLLPDGSLDRQFGLGGLWADAGPEPTEVLDFATSADGRVTLRLRRGVGADAPAEAWALPAGARMPQRVNSAQAAMAGGGSPPLAASGVAAGPLPDSFKQGGSPFEPAAPGAPGSGLLATAPSAWEGVPWPAWALAAAAGLAWLWWRFRR